MVSVRVCREDEILNQLTPNLRAEVAHFAHYDTVRLLKGMKLFENLEDTLLTRLIVALTTQFLPPDELVCAEGELGEVLYIIRKGVVSVRLESTAAELFTFFKYVQNLVCLALSSISSTLLATQNMSQGTAKLHTAVLQQSSKFTPNIQPYLRSLATGWEWCRSSNTVSSKRC